MGQSRRALVVGVAGAMRSIDNEHCGSFSPADDFFAAVVPDESVLFTTATDIS